MNAFAAECGPQPTGTERSRCANCQRELEGCCHIEMTRLARKKAKKYYNIPHVVTCGSVCLCPMCSSYLLDSENRPSSYYPAMVWKFLSHEAILPFVDYLPYSRRWEFIPKEWRPWWMTAMSRLDETLSLESPRPQFILADRAMEEVLEATTHLEWPSLQKAMDEHLAFPSVRCPWGCSEFLHRTNELSFEEFLTQQSNGNFDSLHASKSKQSRWAHRIRPDFPSSVEILENPAFMCHPTLVTSDEVGVAILCCADHSKRSSERYIFAPSSPTGSLHTPCSNQYAQAIIRNRTIRITKYNKYSDTFQTSMLSGGYDGLDSCYLTTSGNYSRSSQLSLSRDALSIAGRQDVRHHVEELSNDVKAKGYLPREEAERKILQAEDEFSVDDVLSLAAKSGATYVSLDDAVNMQETIYEEKSRSIQVYSEGRTEEKLFTTPWPARIFRIHSYAHGERFAAVRDLAKSFACWSMTAAIACVKPMWGLVSDSIQSSEDPNGYLMMLAWKTFGKADGRTGKNDWFKLKKSCYRYIRERVGVTGEAGSVAEEHGAHWETVPGIVTMVDFWRPEAVENDAAEVVVLVTDAASGLSDVFQNRMGWELVLIAGTHKDGGCREEKWDGFLCATHGSEVEDNWWFQRSKNAEFASVNEGIRYVASFVGPILVAVYKKREGDAATRTRRERYFRSLGGQSQYLCGVHKAPLVLNPQRATPICCCERGDVALWDSLDAKCNKACSLVCPHVGCEIGICREHSKGVRPEHVYITSTSCVEASFEELVRGDVIKGTMRKSSVVQTTVDAGTEGQDMQIDEESNDGQNSQSDESDIFQGSLEGEEYSRAPSLTDVGPTTSNNLGNDLFEDIDSESSDEEGDDKEVDNEFIATDAGATPVDFRLQGPEEVKSVPLHVLLNHQGHLLVRRNAKLRMRKRHANFFQRIMAADRGKNMPLVYFEALLFPDCFWFAKADGSILGAVPTALWSGGSFLRRHAVATTKQHATTRLHDPSSLCSTDSRYQFMQFDAITNLGLRGCDTRLVLHRGFAENQYRDGATFRSRDGNEELYGDNIENHSNVHKLSALCAESPPHFFYTQSCNQATCPGLRKLRTWVMSQEAHKRVADKYGIDTKEAEKILRDSVSTYVQRTWNVVIDLWMRYIVYSKEKPLHEIEWAWWRKEYQDKNGNPAHIHALLRTKVDVSTESGRNAVLNKIRGTLSDLVQYEEAQRLHDNKVIDSLEVLVDILEDARKFLTHKCNGRCQIPKTDDNGNVSFICKVPCNAMRSGFPYQHSIQQLPVQHTPEALQILSELGMAAFNPSHNEWDMTEPLLRRERHVPKASLHDGKFSPSNPDLFCRMRSAQNLQFCTGYAVNAYLANYVCDLDEAAVVLIKPPQRAEEDVLRGEYKALNNTKIRSVKNHNSNTKKADKKEGCVGRPVTLMEAMAVIESQALVKCTRYFIHMPTVAREYRAAIFVPYKLAKVKHPRDLVAVRAVTGQTMRLQKRFPPSRLFTQTQLAVIKDELEAPLQMDATTFFSMRPPELRFIRRQKLYLEWFEKESVCPIFDPSASLKYLEEHLSKDVSECEWLDGFNNKITLRWAAVDRFWKHVKTCDPSDFGTGKDCMTLRMDMINLMDRMKHLHDVLETKSLARRQTKGIWAQWKKMKDRFLCKKRHKNLPVVYITPINPKRKTAFLIQLLLQFGSFETEYDLMATGSLKGAYVKAGLFDPRHPEGSVRNIVAKYVLQHLRLQPGSTYVFDRCLSVANDALRELLLGADPVRSQLPPVLYSHMKHDTTEESDNHLYAERQRLIDTLYEDMGRCGFRPLLPSKQAVLLSRDNPLPGSDIGRFYPPPRCERQNLASFEEQGEVFNVAKRLIDAYLDGKKHTKNLIIAGSPGVGKTTVCELITLYCLCKGMNGLPTSLVADRSKQLGGTHLHQLFGIRETSRSPGHIAEQSIRQLYRKPKLLHFLQQMDFLNIDEFGVLSAELVGVLDLILRYVKKSSAFMGGVFVFATMDHLQLLPFSGTPSMLSFYILTDFAFVSLQESVRASKDPALREICNLTRLASWTPQNKARFRRLLIDNTNFVQSFEDETIPEDAVFVFGRKAPCQKAEEIMLDRAKKIHEGNFTESLAEDEESTTAGNWHVASSPTTRRLTRLLKRRHRLTFYPCSRFEFTYNESNLFMQGQLCLVVQVPSEEDLRRRVPVSAWKAPNGVREFPPLANCNEDTLPQLGWSIVKVPFTTSEPKGIAQGLQARRSQYGLRPRVSSTVHACMGSTLPAVVTALVSPPESATEDFGLWEAAQVVVLLSRTEYARQLYFVGNQEATIQHLLSVLETTHRFLPVISGLLCGLCKEGVETPIYSHINTYRPCDAVIGNIACVYLLVSTSNLDYFYIGETKNLSRRLRQHNTGRGAGVTSIAQLMPWAVVAYVLGFKNRNQRVIFEATWKVRSTGNRSTSHTDHGLLHIAQSLVDNHNRETQSPDDYLRIVRCGSITV